MTIVGPVECGSIIIPLLIILIAVVAVILLAVRLQSYARHVDRIERRMARLEDTVDWISERLGVPYNSSDETK